MPYIVPEERYEELLQAEQQSNQLVKDNAQLTNEKNETNERFKMLADIIGVKVAKNDEEESATAISATNANITGVRFVWRNGGSKVFVSGSWDEFKFLYPLRTSLSGDSFVTTLQLQRGQTYKFKYSVNGKWKLNEGTKTDGHFNICELSALASPKPVQSLQNLQLSENALASKNITNENSTTGIHQSVQVQNNVKNSEVSATYDDQSLQNQNNQADESVDLDGSSNEEYEIEKVLGRRLFKTGPNGSFEWKYHIKWRDYDEQTWEPLALIEHVDEVKKYIAKANAQQTRRKRQKKQKTKTKHDNEKPKKKRGRPKKRHSLFASENNFPPPADSISKGNSSSDKRTTTFNETSYSNKGGVKAAIRKSLNVKTGVKVKCKKCGKKIKFYSPSTLKNHINLVHLKLPLFECLQCEKVFYESAICVPQKHIREKHCQDTVEDLIDNRSTYLPQLLDDGLLEEYFCRDDEQESSPIQQHQQQQLEIFQHPIQQP